MKRHFLLLVVVLLLGLASGCQTERVTEPTETPASLPNPASAFCEAHGYTIQMRENAAGTAGYCQFPDGSECDEWAFFRGECWPESLHWGPETIEIVMLESFPLQVQAILAGRLPNSCSVVSEVTQVYDEASHTFTVTLLLAANGAIDCDPAGLPFTETVSLDVLGLPAGSYTVISHDAEVTFTLALDDLGDSAMGGGIPAEIEPIADAIVTSITPAVEP